MTEDIVTPSMLETLMNQLRDEMEAASRNNMSDMLKKIETEF